MAEPIIELYDVMVLRRGNNNYPTFSIKNISSETIDDLLIKSRIANTLTKSTNDIQDSKESDNVRIRNLAPNEYITVEITRFTSMEAHPIYIDDVEIASVRFWNSKETLTGTDQKSGRNATIEILKPGSKIPNIELSNIKVADTTGEHTLACSFDIRNINIKTMDNLSIDCPSCTSDGSSRGKADIQKTETDLEVNNLTVNEFLTVNDDSYSKTYPISIDDALVAELCVDDSRDEIEASGESYNCSSLKLYPRQIDSFSDDGIELPHNFHDLEDYTWEQINELADMAADDPEPFLYMTDSTHGIYKTINLGSIGCYSATQVWIIGVGQDVDEDGRRVGLTLQLRYGLSTSKPVEMKMQNDPQDSSFSGFTLGGWQDCYMRNNNLPLIEAAFPDDLKGFLRPVKKKTNMTYVGSTLTETVDKLFLLSNTEVYGDEQNPNLNTSTWCRGEGERYQWFSTHSMSSYSSTGYSSNSGSWWLRSIADASRFYYVSQSGGSPQSVSVTNTQQPYAGFCLGTSSVEPEPGQEPEPEPEREPEIKKAITPNQVVDMFREVIPSINIIRYATFEHFKNCPWDEFIDLCIDSRSDPEKYYEIYKGQERSFPYSGHEATIKVCDAGNMDRAAGGKCGLYFVVVSGLNTEMMESVNTNRRWYGETTMHNSRIPGILLNGFPPELIGHYDKLILHTHSSPSSEGATTLEVYAHCLTMSQIYSETVINNNKIVNTNSYLTTLKKDWEWLKDEEALLKWYNENEGQEFRSFKYYTTINNKADYYDNQAWTSSISSNSSLIEYYTTSQQGSSDNIRNNISSTQPNSSKIIPTLGFAIA